MNRSIIPPALAASTGAAGQPAEIGKLFRGLYGEECRLFRAPGRINLIGEHTDYNDGFVMPAAIDLCCWAAITPARNRTIEVHSANFNQSRTFDLDRPRALGDWSDYVQGVALMLGRAGYHLPGAKMMIWSKVPMGSGLSSSAALEIATGLALLDTQDASCDHSRLAQICQRAENEFVGARCGIMDQFVSGSGRAGHLLLLDCRSLEHRFLPVPEGVRLVICNTMVKHEIASGEYNVRRSQCEQGVRFLAAARRGLTALRDLSLDDLEQSRDLLPPIIYKRCRHVISENQRVLDAAVALEQRDLQRFGELMAESHRSLRDDYEVSCPELDLLVELANQTEGLYGARMTGGGFGGCTINVVSAESAAEFSAKISSVYQAKTGIAPEVFISTASQGAGSSPPRE